jgi:hypothetical protein
MYTNQVVIPVSVGASDICRQLGIDVRIAFKVWRKGGESRAPEMPLIFAV